MRSSDILLLAALQIPTAALAGAGVYIAVRVRTSGAATVAISLILMFVKSIAGNFIPKESRNVFDENGQLAGATVDAGALGVWLDYSGFALTLLLALGLVLIARDFGRRATNLVPPNTSLERSRD